MSEKCRGKQGNQQREDKPNKAAVMWHFGLRYGELDVRR